MPRFENGVTTASRSLFVGLLESTLVLALASAVSNMGVLFSLGLLLISIWGLMDLSHRITYWGIAYTAGWFLGLIIVGPETLMGWELTITEAIVVSFLALKTIRRIDRAF